MEKKVVKILDFEDKKSSGGKRYTRFKTNEGWMSAFDKETIEKLKEAEEKVVNISVATDNEKGWKNIRSFDGLSDNGDVEDTKTEKLRTGNGTASMYASYAKDIFIELWKAKNGDKPKDETVLVTFSNALMAKAIDLVRQAKEAFE